MNQKTAAAVVPPFLPLETRDYRTNSSFEACVSGVSHSFRPTADRGGQLLTTPTQLHRSNSVTFAHLATKVAS